MNGLAIGFDGWCDCGPETALTAVDDLAARAGLAPGRDEPSRGTGRRRRRYQGPNGDDALKVGVGAQGQLCQILISPMPSALRRAIGDAQLCALLGVLCDAASARIGRTFGESWHGVVQEGELQGRLEWLDWFQYWDAEVARPWGFARIKAGPFHLVKEAKGGGCSVMLMGDPEDPAQESRRSEAAKYLGIRLRSYPKGVSR